MVLALIISLLSVAVTIAAIWIVLTRIGPRRPLIDVTHLPADDAERAALLAALDMQRLRRMSSPELIEEIVALRVMLANAKREAVEAQQEAADALRRMGQRPSPRSRDLRERQWRARRELPDAPSAAPGELHVVA